MDEQTALKTMAIPERALNFVPAKAGEILQLGPITCRTMEDGTNTDNRIGSAEFIIPPGTKGPPAHWHEMHDETFLITAGTIRFFGSDRKTADAKAGDYVVVSTRAPHTFENPSDTEEARFFNTFTPAYYVNYFRLMHDMLKDGKPLDGDTMVEAMSRFATLPAPGV
ncbi:RmlC-like cupin domain-containing protein [Diplogelasinospora grovesii]|uniref:RmlC-like cupin domain-containing protein n=1 Tax=Diplogelasinospora grovesii TaxID=303347 RepID=A0AAN6S2L5_9PEZI|nr:RmlC-like cupin domain-containing protein [Diplogelasinospora grovesii]